MGRRQPSINHLCVLHRRAPPNAYYDQVERNAGDLEALCDVSTDVSARRW